MNYLCSGYSSSKQLTNAQTSEEQSQILIHPHKKIVTNRIQTARESQKEQHLSEHLRQAVGKNPATVKQGKL